MKSLKFLDTLAKTSAQMYTSHYRNYFRLVYKLDREIPIPSSELERLADTYFAKPRNYQADVEKFFVSLKDRPPLTIATSIAVVKTLLIENNVELPSRFWKGLSRRTKGNRARTIDRIPSNSELRTILMGMSIQGRTFYAVAATSGMRINEILQLKLEDIDINSEPAKVSIRGEYTKTGNPRITFISSEAKELVEKWLPQRRAYIESSSARSQNSFGNEKGLESDRAFPFSKNVAQQIWTNSVRKAGLLQKDSSTGRATLHPHVLRKFFRTQLGKVSIDVTEALLGHEGYLTEAYRRYTPEQIADFYRENEAVLAIFADQKVISKAVENNQKGIQATLGGLAVENSRLKEEVDALAKRVADNEAFTRKFLNASPEQLARIGKRIIKENLEDSRDLSD